MRLLFIFSLLMTSLFSLEFPQVRLDSTGNALALWTDNIDFTIESSMKSLAGSWTTPIPISNQTLSSNPQLVLNGLGNGAAIWVGVNDETGGHNLYGAMFVGNAVFSLSAWTTSKRISDSTDEVLTDYQIRLTDSGNVMAIWTDVSNGITKVKTSSGMIDSSNTWSAPVTIISD